MAQDQGTVTLTTDQFKELLSAVGGRIGLDKQDQLDLIEAQAAANAKATKQALRPENERHPGISAYSRPGGELANPKGMLRCPTFWAGAKQEEDVLTADELDLLNAVVPGEYTCTKSDGTRFAVTVTGEKNPETGAYRKIDVMFVTRGTNRHNLPGMASMLREMVATKAPA